MAATNYDCNGFFEQRSQIAQMHFGSCKVEAARGIHYSNSSAKESQGIQRIHISNNTYYGHHPVKPNIAVYHDVDDTRLMDCDMAPISQFTPERTLGRKRPSDDVSYASYKRFRQEELAPPLQDAAPQSFARQTHCNPDITRCLMAHMI